MAFSMTIELEDGGTVMYDNVVSYTVEESDPPDEDLEEGDPEREGGSTIDETEEAVEELEVEVDLSDEDEEEGDELAKEMAEEEKA